MIYVIKSVPSLGHLTDMRHKHCQAIAWRLESINICVIHPYRNLQIVVLTSISLQFTWFFVFFKGRKFWFKVVDLMKTAKKTKWTCPKSKLSSAEDPWGGAKTKTQHTQMSFLFWCLSNHRCQWQWKGTDGVWKAKGGIWTVLTDLLFSPVSVQIHESQVCLAKIMRYIRLKGRHLRAYWWMNGSKDRQQ